MWEQLVTFVTEQVEQNEIFKGGLLLMVGGALLALVRGWPARIWSFIKRQSMVVIDIPDKDQAFKWVNLWLAEHNYSKKWARLITVKTERNDRQYDKPQIIFSPAPGEHWLWYKRRLVILSRNRQQMGEDSGVGSNRDPFREYFTIRILGRRRDLAYQLIEEAYELACPHTVDKITIHRAKHYGDWIISNWIPKRNLSSIILPNGMEEELVDDIQTFLDSEDWYVKRGLPYRRGYLLYGPPGNGKTSLVLGLATHFNLDIALLNLKVSSMSDDDLSDALASAPQNSIIFIEDIDCVVAGRQVEADAISFSGLLNALDGLSASHGQLVIMTTNHREKLDEALIRPGRCDVQMEFPNADKGQKARMFERFFPDSGLAHEFSNRVPGDISMASLQKHMMMYRDNPRVAFDNAINIVKDVDEQKTPEKGTRAEA